MPSTPSGLQVQKLLGSMRDRGATCAVLECSDVGIATGDLGFIDMAVVVHTNFTGSGAERAPFGGDREKVLEAQLGLFDTLLDASAQVCPSKPYVKASHLLPTVMDWSVNPRA